MLILVHCRVEVWKLWFIWHMLSSKATCWGGILQLTQQQEEVKLILSVSYRVTFSRLEYMHVDNQIYIFMVLLEVCLHYYHTKPGQRE